jgi:DNA-binding transcriptional MerR regulator
MVYHVIQRGGEKMLRIGEVAKEFNISNRTLRHWEDMGILESVRAENDYRYYDEDNILRINQIVLLRNFKMPLGEIERIFIAKDAKIAIDALTSHLDNLKDSADTYSILGYLVERLLASIKEANNLEEVFSYLETQSTVTDLKHNDIPQIKLSERMNVMKKERLENVRIVKLPAMTVASYCVKSTTPEEDCSKVFDPFVFEHELHKRSGYRYFGFNNPDPTEDGQEYGYELWVTIPDDFNLAPPFEKKQFDGGLYASISTTISEIGERWELLYNWLDANDKYDCAPSNQWLEECSMDIEIFLSEDSTSERQLDLLMPIYA